MADDLANNAEFLSDLPAGARERRQASRIVWVLAIGLIATLPFAKIQLPVVWAFIPTYQSALVINDLITGILLYSQYAQVRSAGLLILVCAYTFSALIACVHLLTFPGLVTQAGLFGAGPQTTAWLYMFWHSGFPAFLIVYAVIKRRYPTGKPLTASNRGLSWALASVVILVAILTLVATRCELALPKLILNNHYTPAMIGVVGSVWACSILALALLVTSKPYSLLDVWLMVVLCAWLCDIALAAVLNAGRFDLGFYAGRIYGLAAASIVLAILLLENGKLYAQLVQAHRKEQQTIRQLAAVNKELEAFTYSVSHDLRAPLRAIDSFSALLEKHAGPTFDSESTRLLSIVRQSTRQMSQLINDLLAFAKLSRQSVRYQTVDVSELVHQVIDAAQLDYAGRQIEFNVGELGNVAADAALLRQVFVNLIGNAIKYTGKRPLAIIDVHCDRTDPTQYCFTVRDNGAGFDMRYAGKLFGVFQRLHRMDEFEGTGVGLAIVQRIVERHGGCIWAESALNQGATFHFTLPASPIDLTTPPLSTPTP